MFMRKKRDFRFKVSDDQNAAHTYLELVSGALALFNTA